MVQRGFEGALREFLAVSLGPVSIHSLSLFGEQGMGKETGFHMQRQDYFPLRTMRWMAMRERMGVRDFQSPDFDG